MKDISIYGAGAFGHEIASLIVPIKKSIQDGFLLVFFDDEVAKNSIVSHFGIVLVGMDEPNEWPKPIDISIAIGSPQALKYVRGRI